ncbi:MAG: hypothetical protein ABIN79_04650 [Marmoricola sp.]
MDEPQPTPPRGSGIGTTALGRLQLRVPGETGPVERVVERRWPDTDAARTWCERFVSRLDPEADVLEIQIFEESWSHPPSWESRPNRPEFRALQVGMLLEGGRGVLWGHTRPMTPSPGARRLA